MASLARTVAILIAVTAILGAAPAPAAVVFSESFDGSVTTGTEAGGEYAPSAAGKAWRSPKGHDDYSAFRGVLVDLEEAGLPALPQGTIEMWIQRGEKDEWEAPFALLDAEFNTLFLAEIVWSGDQAREGRPNLKTGGAADWFWYDEYTDETVGGVTSRTPYLVIDQSISGGSWFRVALTWGPSPAVYVNGSRLRAKAEADFPFAEALGSARYISIGGVAVGSAEAGATGTEMMMASPIDAFRIHDSVVGAGPSVYQGVPEADIAAVDHDAGSAAGFSGNLVAGDTVAVTLLGSAGGTAAFDVARLADRRGEITVSWKGWGVYLEEKVFFDEGEIDLGDVEEYRVYAGTEPVTEVTDETEAAEILEVEEQTVTLERLEIDVPYFVTVMAVMDDGTFVPVVEPRSGLPMTALEGSPGVYEGTWTVGYGDRYREAVIVGRLVSGSSSDLLVDDEVFTADPSLNIEVAADPGELKADEESTAEVTVTVTDANGDAVSDHEIRFLLATTSQYTGVVGGGNFTAEAGGTLERDFRGRTDLFGEATATYTAGFAAKTAIIVARDMQSNDVGAGYIKTYINAAAQLELEAPQQTAGKALGYTITVTSSDEWLTADGKSEARITAFVAKDGIPAEGHRVGFTVASGSGRIRTVRGETDSSGKARAVYTAGTRIGVVLIRATDHTAGISGTVQVELRSDAPAKITLALTPEVLDADGRSTAEIAVVVTDINDNPNEGVEVEYAVRIGSGRIRDVEPVTDRRGESSAEYVAGTIPGRVSIEVTVRSAAPTGEELAAAADLATAVLDYDFY